MKVVDHEPGGWVLLEDGGALFLDGHCNRGSFGYGWLIELDRDERSSFDRRGRAFIRWLAEDIENGAPALNLPESPYRGRNCNVELGHQVREAIRIWQAQ